MSGSGPRGSGFRPTQSIIDVWAWAHSVHYRCVDPHSPLWRFWAWAHMLIMNLGLGPGTNNGSSGPSYYNLKFRGYNMISFTSINSCSFWDIWLQIKFHSAACKRVLSVVVWRLNIWSLGAASSAHRVEGEITDHSLLQSDVVSCRLQRRLNACIYTYTYARFLQI